MIHGNKYESVARELYAKETVSFIQECGLIVSKSEPWLAYSPDGIVIKNSRPSKLLEIKCPFNLQDTEKETLLKKCKFLCLVKDDLKLKTRHQYYAQIQFGMALLNLKYCDFVIYSNVSHTIKIITVDFNEEYACDLLTALKNNYFKKCYMKYVKIQEYYKLRRCNIVKYKVLS